MSLGGMRDEAEIRGHRRTYIGALPGRIIQSLRKAGTRNPVFMLDEIDKLGTDFRGDPASAMLEVLDPAQNNSFTDHYLDVPFDLSAVLFIATGNIIDTMPAPLRDRMEILELPGYTLQEKAKIAVRHLVPRQIENHGLKKSQVRIPAPALEKVIADYTREAGVRNLDREIAAICRKLARRVAEGKTRPVTVRPQMLHDLLGPVRFESEVAEKRTVPGVVTGLAWTPTGGDILFIEATRMPGKGNLILTGSLGDVMKESARAALSYVRAHAAKWKLSPHFADETDFHIHVPAGAIPKDGPSAGVAMLSALFSLVMQARCHRTWP
jgi:ATP-dependent Lon protease